MTAKITGKRGDRYLVDFGEGTGSIYDPDGDIHVPAERRGYVGRSGLLGGPRYTSTNGGADAHRPEHSPGCS